MNTTQTHIIILLDESGSMEDLSKSTISSVNEFIKEQSHQNGDTSTFLTVRTFNDKLETPIRKRNINEVTEFNDYIPSGRTMLYDTIGATIKEFSDDQNVIVCIVTDGQDNMSTIYTGNQIKEMITKAEKKNWRFIFLAANQDAFVSASRLGIQMSGGFESSPAGVSNAFRNMSANVSNIRYANTSVNLRSTAKPSLNSSNNTNESE
jgi:hypothetical protein